MELRLTEETRASQLNSKHLRFIDEYLIDMNATKAYMRAYPDSTRDAAKVSAHHLLTNPNIKEEIGRKLDESSQDLRTLRERVLREYQKIAFSDMRDLANWDDGLAKLKASSDIDDNAAAAISEISSDGEKTKVKLHSKIAALEKLSEYAKLVTKEEAASTNVNITIDSNDAKM